MPFSHVIHEEVIEVATNFPGTIARIKAAILKGTTVQGSPPPSAPKSK